MTESEARDILLLRAIERAPQAPASWNDDDRTWASRTAAGSLGANARGERFVIERTRVAIDRLAARSALVRQARRAAAWPHRAAWLVCVVAFAVGVAGDAMSASRDVNVLAPPLLAVVVWNLIIYLALLSRHVMRRIAGNAGSSARSSAPLLQRFTEKLVQHRLLSVGRRAPADRRWLRSGLPEFLADWARAGAALTGRRIARTLHLAALAVALGLLAGLYVRGLILEYRAVWESTFLGAAAVRDLLGLLLSPAALLTGIELPDVQRLQAMRLPTGTGEPAAPWIHLYAVTVALIVVIPRLLLALHERIRERRLVRAFPLPVAASDPWYAAQVREYAGTLVTVALIPCHFAPAHAHVERLQRALDLLTAGAWRLVVAPVIEYGSEEKVTQALAAMPAPGVVSIWFGASATPERETHGVLLERLEAACVTAARPIALVDESAFVGRFGGADDSSQRRRAERRQAWQNLFRASGTAAVFIDAERDDDAALAASLRPAVAGMNLAGHDDRRRQARGGEAKPLSASRA